MRSQFWGKNYYEILNVKCTATLLEIRSSFRKLALKLHPDKVDESNKAQATIDFQYLINVVDILSDSNKKALYDLTKEDVLTNENADTTNMKSSDYYQRRFVTIADILSHQEKYVGSDEEVNDVIEAYSKYKGNMTAIIETIMHSTQDDTDRFRVIIDTAQRTGVVKVAYPIYFGPSHEIDLTEEGDMERKVIIDEANAQGYFEEDENSSTTTKRARIENKHTHLINLPETKAIHETKDIRNGLDTETKHIIQQTAPHANALQSGMSMKERNYHRIMNLCSSLEKRYKPRDFVEPTITEEEFQRAAAKLESRRNSASTKRKRTRKG